MRPASREPRVHKVLRDLREPQDRRAPLACKVRLAIRVRRAHKVLPESLASLDRRARKARLAYKGLPETRVRRAHKDRLASPV